jgi:hypothetical protein
MKAQSLLTLVSTGLNKQGEIRMEREPNHARTSRDYPKISNTKAIFWQTIALILTIVGLWVAAEHRVTIAEEKISAVEHQQLILGKQNEIFVEKIENLSANQVKMVTLLDVIDKRHSLEDQRRALAH